MRKSNWLVATVAAIAVGALLWLWYFLGFNRIDSPLDLVIAIVWWLVIALVVVAITRAEAKRREKMRTAFVGEGFLYNPETGLITADQGESEVSLLEHTLATLTYPDKVKTLDEDAGRTFRWVVYSHKFDQDNDIWEGEVRPAHNPDEDPTPFDTRESLVALLSA